MVTIRGAITYRGMHIHVYMYLFLDHFLRDEVLCYDICIGV